MEETHTGNGCRTQGEQFGCHYSRFSIELVPVQDGRHRSILRSDLVIIQAKCEIEKLFNSYNIVAELWNRS